MLDLQFVRKHPERVEKALADRFMDLSLKPLQALDKKRREMLTEVEQLKHKRKESSKDIGRMMKAGEDAGPLREEMKQVGDTITTIDEQIKATDAAIFDFMKEIPNIPHESVPIGKDETANEELRRWGDPRTLDFEPKAHWDLGTDLGILDFERAAKITGSRFCVYRGQGARLERALISFMLDLHTSEHGYQEILPPYMVNADALYGTGQLPKFESDLFKTEPGGFYLIPTAEVPVTNLHADEILDDESLPVAYCAYTPCFRSEAGSYGQDVRGLIRQHQFNKVELVRFSRPEESYEQLERLTGHAETVLQKLGLPYRVMTLSTGDTSFSSAKTYDIEVWLPGQNTFREISSCSNFEDFQARRAKIRYRKEAGAKPQMLHTLNGSGLAAGRTLVAVLENYQRADGTIEVPEALRPYMGGLEVIGKEKGVI